MSGESGNDDSDDPGLTRTFDAISQSSDGEELGPPQGHPWFQHRRPAERRDDSEIFDPPEEWRTAFGEQATKETFAAALGYAYKKAELVQLAGVHVDDDYVAALVQDAIGDTIAGRIRWRFERVSLANHLKDTIRLRTYRQTVRARKYRHESIEASGDEADDFERPTEIEASLALRDGAEDRDDLAVSDVVAQVFDAVQRELGGDVAALAILDAYRHEIVDRRDVVAHTGLTDDDYHNARRRLARAVLRVPAELRAAAVEVMSR